MSLMHDFQVARRIVYWERKGSKRRQKSQVARFIVIAIYLIVAMIFAAIFSVVGLIAAHTQTAKVDFVQLMSFIGCALILFIQLQIFYNLIFVTDSSMLLVAPVSGRTILLSRLWSSFPISVAYMLEAIPLIIAFGSLTHAAWFYYPIAILTWALAVCSMFGLAVLILLFIMRVLKKTFSRDQLAVASSIVAVLVFIGPRLVMAHKAAHHLASSMSFLSSPEMSAVPFLWFGRVMAGIEDSVLSSLGYFALLILLSGITYLASFAIAEGHLRERLTLLKDNVGVANVKTPSTKLQSVRLNRGRFPRGAWAVTRKDLIRLKRTAGDLVNYLFPTAYLLYFITERGQNQYALLPLFIIIIAGTMGRIPISSFGVEEEQVWHYLQAPISRSAIVAGKWLYGTLPTIVWWEVLVVLIAIFKHSPLPLAITLACAGLWLLPSAVVLSLPFAINSASFKGRRVGRRNVYVKGSAQWYLLILSPYLILQAIPLGFALLPFILGTSNHWSTFLIHSVSGHLVTGIVLSLAMAVVASLIGWSMSVEAWHHKTIKILEAGSLE